MKAIKYLSSHAPVLAAVVALLMVQAVCELSLPGLTADLVDIGVLGGVTSEAGIDMPFMLATGARMLGVTVLAAVASVAISFLASRTSARIGADLRSRMFAKVVSFSDAEIDRFSAASLITRATNDVQQVQQVCMITMRMVLFAPIMAIGGIVMIMRSEVHMTWVIVVAVVAVAVVVATLMAFTMPKFRLMQTLIDRLNLVAREILTGLPVIRAFNRQPYEQKRFDDASRQLMDTQLFTGRAMSLMQPAMMLIMNGVSVLIVWVASGLIDEGMMQTGDMIAFITYAMVIISSFLMLSMVFIMLPRADVAAGRIDEVLACESSISDPEHPRDAELGSGEGAAIAFDHVTFSYGDSDEPALCDISFAIPPGSVAAIIGPTGSGKSTLLKLMLRSYDVTAGSVSIDGIDVRDLSLAALHEQLAYVPQASFLFTGTIRSNIAYADGDMPEQRIVQAAEIAQAADFIAAGQDGFDREVSQGGTNVSGGQRQRLAIARALASDGRALLLDDSFSALDYATDAALRAALSEQMGGRTLVIVAQRIATVRNADQIIVLDGGRVVGVGTHEQLLATCSTYREIAASQLSEEELAMGGDAA